MNVNMAKVMTWSLVIGCLCTFGEPSYSQSPAGTVEACSIADARKPEKCSEHMFATTVHVDAQPGAYATSDDPPCKIDSQRSEMKRQLEAAFQAYPSTAMYAGPLADFVGTPVEKEAVKVGGDLGKWISPFVNGNYATCAPLTVVLPAKAHVVGKRLYGGDDSGAAPIGECFVDKPPCVGGWARFEDPVEATTGGVTTVYTIFKNWSHDRVRHAAMTVFFTLPPRDNPAKTIPNI